MSLEKALETVKSIKLTGGIFGKTTLLLVVLTVCMTAAAISLEIWWVTLLLLLPMIALATYTVKRCFDFAESNPQAAIMDGAELLVHERIVHEQKGGIKIVDENAVRGKPQPRIEDVDKADLPPLDSLENTDASRGSQ